jgi:hypothetical protein
MGVISKATLLLPQIDVALMPLFYAHLPEDVMTDRP